MQKLNTFFHKVFPKKVAALFTSRKRETNFNRGITGFNPVKDKKQKKGLKFQKKKNSVACYSTYFPVVYLGASDFRSSCRWSRSADLRMSSRGLSSADWEGLVGAGTVEL